MLRIISVLAFLIFLFYSWNYRVKILKKKKKVIKIREGENFSTVPFLYITHNDCIIAIPQDVFFVIFFFFIYNKRYEKMKYSETALTWVEVWRGRGVWKKNPSSRMIKRIIIMIIVIIISQLVVETFIIKYIMNKT